MLSHQLINSNEQTFDRRDRESRRAYRHWRSEVFEQLLLADMDDDAMLWESCHAQPKRTAQLAPDVLPEDVAGVFCCPDHRDHCNHIVYHSCDLRYCPDCARRHAARLVHQYLPVIESALARNRKGFKLRKIVLTTSIDPTHPDAKMHYESGFDSARSVMDELLGPAWRKNSGVIDSAEFGEDGLKLHYHLLVYSKFIPQQKLSDSWRRHSLDGSSIVYIADAMKIYPDAKTAIRETLKYATKFFKKDQNGVFRGLDPKMVPHIAKILKGTRRIRSWGIFYGAEKPERKLECEVCHKPMIRIPLEGWKTYTQDALGFSPQEFLDYWRGSYLNLILANKSSPQEDKPPPQPPPQEGKNLHLPGFEPSDDIGISHYEI